jgi:hypothetical protein
LIEKRDVASPKMETPIFWYSHNTLASKHQKTFTLKKFTIQKFIVQGLKRSLFHVSTTIFHGVKKC